MKPKNNAEPKLLSILGSTGSIGKSTIKLVEQHQDKFSLAAITGNNNVGLLTQQALRYKPKMVVIADESKYLSLKQGLAGVGIKTATGRDGLQEAADLDSDIVVAAIVGSAGLEPTITAVRRGAQIALANKECLVCAGDIFMQEAHVNGAVIIPVDSEHSAIFQSLDQNHRNFVEKITLTASGGPFLRTPREQMRDVTPEQAVSHPNWDMGAKISVDSATMMNKGLEMIEAHHLFAIPPARIDVVVHPESIIHGMVHYSDGSVVAQMSIPDMCTPIAYALAWPERIQAPCARLDLVALGRLTFEQPDLKKFPSLAMAFKALKAGTHATNILNAANEVAVEAFLHERIGFLQISETVANVLEKMTGNVISSVESAIKLDAEARKIASREIDKIKKYAA